MNIENYELGRRTLKDVRSLVRRLPPDATQAILVEKFPKKLIERFTVLCDYCDLYRPEPLGRIKNEEESLKEYEGIRL